MTRHSLMDIYGMDDVNEYGSNPGSHFTVNYDNLSSLDGYLKVEHPEEYDAEIENIVEHLWDGIGEYEELLRPFFSSFLQAHLLRSLYIHFLALSAIRAIHENITVEASTVILDIIAHHLGLALSPDRTFHDEEYFLVRHYDFLQSVRSRRPWWKRVLNRLRYAGMGVIARFRGIDVVYLNAGKLDDDFSRIPKAFPAHLIPLRQSRRLDCDVNVIKKRVRNNIKAMRLSIPNSLVLKLVEKKLLAYLPDIVNRIGTYAQFIEKHKVRLVVVSAVTHEDHLCPLAAAKLTGVESLILPHGPTLAVNPYLHHYVTYQATLNGIDPQYADADQLHLRMRWYHG